jgi:hypothetical protein
VCYICWFALHETFNQFSTFLSLVLQWFSFLYLARIVTWIHYNIHGVTSNREKCYDYVTRRTRKSTQNIRFFGSQTRDKIIIYVSTRGHSNSDDNKKVKRFSNICIQATWAILWRLVRFEITSKTKFHVVRTNKCNTHGKHGHQYSRNIKSLSIICSNVVVYLSSFSSCLDQVWNILFPNILFKRQSADQRKTFVTV